MYRSNAVVKSGLDALARVNFDKTTKCLMAVAGVGGFTAGLIVGACAAMCITSAALCGDCVTGFATVGGASIAGIVGCFSLT